MLPQHLHPTTNPKYGYASRCCTADLSGKADLTQMVQTFSRVLAPRQDHGMIRIKQSKLTDRDHIHPAFVDQRIEFTDVTCIQYLHHSNVTLLPIGHAPIVDATFS